MEKKPYARPWAEWTDFSLAEAIAAGDGGDDVITPTDPPSDKPPEITPGGEVIDWP